MKKFLGSIEPAEFLIAFSTGIISGVALVACLFK